MEGRPQEVIVKDFDMSFFRMVWFMVKWAIASIPAAIILLVIGGLAFGVIMAAMPDAFGP